MQQNNDYDKAPNPYQSPFVASEEPQPTVRQIYQGDNFRPFRTIWTRPRDTVRSVVAINPQLHVTLLVCLVGIINSLNRASSRNLGDKIPLPLILIGAFLIGPLGGLISLWISSHLIRLTGNWIGGIGNREHIKTAIAWASVPVVFTAPLWIVELLIFGSEIFSSETPRMDSQPMLLIPLLVTALIEIVFGIWSIVLLCNTIAEVQSFRSAWSGLGNLVLAGTIFLIPIFLLVFSIILMTKAV